MSKSLSISALLRELSEHADPAVRELADRARATREANEKRFMTCSQCGEFCAESYVLFKGGRQTIHFHCLGNVLGHVPIPTDLTHAPVNDGIKAWYWLGHDRGMVNALSQSPEPGEMP